MVAPGNYAEQLRLDRSISVVAEHGPGSVVVTGTPGSGETAVLVDGLDCALRGLTVKAADDSGTPVVAISAGAGLLLEDCTVSGGRIHARGNETGSDAGGSDLAGYGITTVVLRRSQVEDARLAALHLSGRVRAKAEDAVLATIDGIGVVLSGAASLEATRLRLESTVGYGVRLRGNSRLRLAESVVRKTGMAGVLLEDSATGVLEDLRIDRSAFSAVHLTGAATSKLTDCLIRGGAEHGVHATSDTTIELSACGISDTGMTGLSVVDGAKLTAEGCWITGGATGIHLGSGARVR